MSCARIRNKPVKFLDPQEKVIVELKHEIKRLKLENRKLRTTLLTAPSTLSLNHHGFSDDDASVLSSPSFRALSAHNNRTGSKLSSQQELIDRRKKNKQQPGKSKKVKKSDIFVKYPQLNSILQKEQKQQHAGNVDLRLRPQLKSVMDSYTSLNSEPSVRDSVNDGPKRRISIDVLDEMVHRRASGPLIFKDPTSPIPSIIEQVANKYNPADNYTKQMDKKVNSFLNESPMNKSGIKPEQDDDTGAESHEEDNESRKNSKSNYKVIDAEQLLKKKSTKKKKKIIPKCKKENLLLYLIYFLFPVPPKVTKPSPYLSHLYNKEGELVKKAVGQRPLGSQQHQSLPVLPKIRGEVELNDGKKKQKETDPSRDVDEEGEDLHSSIEKLWEEFGVGPTSSVVSNDPSRKATKNQTKVKQSSSKESLKPTAANATKKKNKLESTFDKLNTPAKQAFLNADTVKFTGPFDKEKKLSTSCTLPNIHSKGGPSSSSSKNRKKIEPFSPVQLPPLSADPKKHSDDSDELSHSALNILQNNFNEVNNFSEVKKKKDEGWLLFYFSCSFP
jgi:hypothetical protein